MCKTFTNVPVIKWSVVQAGKDPEILNQGEPIRKIIKNGGLKQTFAPFHKNWNLFTKKDGTVTVKTKSMFILK